MVFCRSRAVFFVRVAVLFWILSVFSGVPAQAAETEEDKSSILEGAVGEYAQEFMEDIQLEEVQALLDEMLGEERFSLSEALGQMIKGEQPFSRENFLKAVRRAVSGEFDRQRKALFQIILLVLTAALFSNFSRAFEKGTIAEVSFYAVYLLLFMLLVHSFGGLSGRLGETLGRIVILMKAVTPAYYLAVAVSSGVTTATLFYEMILMLVLAVEVLAVHAVIPCINLYVLLQLVNYLSKEKLLSRLAELLRMLVEWSLKTMLGVLLGLQVIRSLVTPVIDTLRRSVLGRTAGAIPGVGGAINSVTEVILTGAVLIRNSLGVVFLAAFALWGITPLMWYALNAFLYKLLAALIQPVSDSRITGCINTLSEGCILLLKTLFAVQALCMLSIVIIAGTR